MKLYTWWRSQAAFRVRITLNLKRINAEYVFVDLAKAEQKDATYRAVNPEMVLPTLIDDSGARLHQSLAIIEYLEEEYPEHPVLPTDARARAFVRGIAHTIVADAHPFVVPRVRNYLKGELAMGREAETAWLRHWTDTATAVVETRLADQLFTGLFCYGDKPTIADICLVPHVTSAIMLYDCDLTPFPLVNRIYRSCMELPEFANAHPNQQPDAQPL
jgi:maleylacetoacetate isomerase